MSVGEITHQQKSVMTGNMRKCQTAGSFPARFCVGVVKLGYTSLKHGYMSRGSDHGCGLHLIRAAKALCWFDSSRQQTRCGFAVGASESLDKRPGVSPGTNTEAAAWGIGGTLVGRHDKYPDQRRQECGRRPLYQSVRLDEVETHCRGSVRPASVLVSGS